MGITTAFSSYIQSIKGKLLNIITEEWSDHKVALAISLGLVIGLVPFFLGLSIYLSLLVAWRFKLNHILIQLISNIIYPLQLLMFIPFLKFGTTLFSSQTPKFSFNIILSLVTNDPMESIRLFGLFNIYGILLWLIISLLFTPILYFITKRIIRNLHLQKRYKSVQSEKLQSDSM